MVFSHERVETLNQLEQFVYKFVVSHLEECKSMTIRELANQSHVSSTTILRFLKKMGFDGFTEFKYALRHESYNQQLGKLTQDLGPVGDFLNQAQHEEFQTQIDRISQLLTKAHTRLLLGMGSSGSMAQYGARMLSNYGLFSLAINDPYQPQPFQERDYTHTLIIFLSVSGQTEAIVKQALYYQQHGAQTVAITANADSILAQVVDVNLVYNIPQTKVGDINFTSQIPVVYLLEQLSQSAHTINTAIKAKHKI